jgi:hypothetical protein
MMRSDAWHDMSFNARRMLDLLEIENMLHGGHENGRLILTYNQIVKSGISRGSIPDTIKEVERLRWIEVTRGGYRDPGRSWPNRYRLTHRRTEKKNPETGATEYIEPTHDWRRYQKPVQVVQKAVPSRFRKRYANGKSASTDSCETAVPTPHSRVPESEPPYISRGGGRGSAGGMQQPTLVWDRDDV